MNANSSSKKSTQKRAALPSRGALIFLLLRMFWGTVLALLVVVVYGLRSGWATPRQWSDGFFIAALVQVMIAGIAFLGTPGEAYYASSLRYVADSNITQNFQQLMLDMFRQKKFVLGTFIGALLTTLISAIVLWV